MHAVKRVARQSRQSEFRRDPAFPDTDLHPSSGVVGAGDAEHIGIVYEGFCRQGIRAAASV